MKGIKVGYQRVSSQEQSVERQLIGVEVDRLFVEKASGKDIEGRPQLQELMKFVREGDIVITDSMDRMARSLSDLKQIVTHLTEKGVQVQFIKENLTFSGNDSPMSQLLLAVLGGFSEFERAIIRDRQKAGIDLAKAKGVYRGRKPKFTPAQTQELIKRIESGESKTTLAKSFGVSRVTLYSHLKRNGVANLSPTQNSGY